MRLVPYIFAAILFATVPAAAQQSLDLSRPAKELFGAHSLPTASEPQPFGSYALGCLAGGMQLPETGPSWQAMRLGRNRNWGHPALIEFLGRLGGYAQAAGWPGIYVGDMSQPRGGPMRTGHRSHQIGLDADVWLRRPSGEVLTREQREQVGSYVVVAADGINLNDNWTPGHHALLRAAAMDPAVARIFVNGAIKRALCLAEPPGGDRAWLSKIRPWAGHDAHFHVRLKCPPDAPGCVNQGAPAPGDGCGAELIGWFDKLDVSEAALGLSRSITRSITRSTDTAVADLPNACLSVLTGDANALAAVGSAPGTFGEGAAAATYVDDPSSMIHLPLGVVDANRGLTGSRYFWTAPIMLDSPLVPHVRLAVEGTAPPGLFFVDRGEGFGILKGVPATAGVFGMEIELSYAGRTAARLPVSVEIGASGPTPEEIAALNDPAYRVRNFVEEFEGGECFFAEATETDGASAIIVALADQPEPVLALDAAFKSAMGFEAQILGQLLSPGQCESMRLFGSVPEFGGDEPVLVMDRTQMPVGEALTGRIYGLGERSASLFLVDVDGEVRDIAGYLAPEPDGSYRFGVPINRRGPHVVVAVATPNAVEAPDSSEPEEPQRFFDGFLLRVMRYNFGYRMTYRYLVVE